MEYELKHEVVTLACARSVEAECKAKIDTAQTFLEASYAVTITQEPRATIARDLSKYLPKD